MNMIEKAMDNKGIGDFNRLNIHEKRKAIVSRSVQCGYNPSYTMDYLLRITSMFVNFESMNEEVEC